MHNTNTLTIRILLSMFCLVAVLYGADFPAQAEDRNMTRGIEVRITVASQVLTATFLDNATTRDLVSRFPMTVPMMDLYDREMCYRFVEALPAEKASRSGYDVGDIAYWTPRHSFVIFYEQNCEVISDLQKIGHIHSGVDVFSTTGDTNVTFEVVNK